MKTITTFLLALILTHAAFSQGYYLEFKMSSTSSDKEMSGNMKAYYQDGSTRMEMDMKVPAIPGRSVSFTSLVLSNALNTVYLLDEKNKQYSELSSNTEEDYKDYQQNEYEVTVLGKEKVNGYNSTHVKIKVKGKKFEQEMWTSTEIADYASYSKMKSKYTGKENLLKALEAKGAAGFPVRFVVQERGGSVQIDLVKAEKKNNPAALFSLNGYTKGEGMPSAPAGMDIQEMMKNMQNMSPEEREQMIQRLQQQYGQSPR